MCCNLFICGLVNRSSQRTTSRNPFQESGLVMPKDTGSLHVSRRSPALARSLERGLSLVTSKIVRTPQSGLANGPTWAALKKHRMPRKGEPEETGAQGASMGGKPAGPLNDSLNGDIGRQGRACGVHQPLSKSSGFDEESSGIRRRNTLRNRGYHRTPALGSLWRKNG